MSHITNRVAEVPREEFMLLYRLYLACGSGPLNPKAQSVRAELDAYYTKREQDAARQTGGR